MSEDSIKELALKLSKDEVRKIDDMEIVNKLIDTAQAEFEYYKTKCREMEAKHNTDFYSFKQRVEDAGNENSEEYNELTRWESYELAYREWGHKFMELVS